MNAQIKEVPADAGTTIAEYVETAAALADLRNRYGSVVYDVTTGKGMTEAKQGRAELREHRVSLEKERVRIKAPALTRCREIDTEAKRITAELEALEQAIDAQIKAEEGRKERIKTEAAEAEAARVAAINARFDAIKALPLQATGTADECRALIAQAEAIDPASFREDLVQAAKFEQRLAINGLRAALDRIEQAEADRAELERLRASAAAVQAEADRLAQAERDREEAEQRQAQQREQEARDAAIRQEAAEQATRDAAEALERAEQARIDAAEKAERDQAEAVRQAEARAAQVALDAEAARRIAIARQEAEDAKRAANRAHQSAVNRKALAALVEHNVDELEGKRILDLIATGKIPAVSIAY